MLTIGSSTIENMVLRECGSNSSGRKMDELIRAVLNVTAPASCWMVTDNHNVNRIRNLLLLYLDYEGEDVSIKTASISDTYHALVYLMTESLHVCDQTNSAVAGLDYLWPMLKGVLTVLCIVYLLLAAIRLFDRIAWSSRITVHLFVLIFIAGVIWNYCHAYGKAIASKHAILTTQGDPCHTDMSLTGIITGTLSSIVSTLLINNSGPTTDCEKHMQALYVDALWETSPSTALSITVARLLFDPLKVAAEATNYTFRAMFANIPLTMVPILGGAILYLITMVMLMVFRYQISVPWLLNIRPSLRHTDDMLKGGSTVLPQPTTNINILRRCVRKPVFIHRVNKYRKTYRCLCVFLVLHLLV